MNNENWVVKINNVEYSGQSEVYIYRKIGDMIEYLQSSETGLNVHREKFEFSKTLIKPLFRVHMDECMSIVKAFVTYANSQGFKNADETFNKGKLEATQDHLADMRKIVFKTDL